MVFIYFSGITLSAVELVLDTLWSWARDACPQGDRRHWIIMVFGDQDDMLVEILLCFLDIHTTIKQVLFRSIQISP